MPRDPFSSTLEAEADWVEPYDAAETETAAANDAPRMHAPVPWLLGTAIRAAKQWLVFVLWLWASPAMLVISSIRGADALALHISPSSLPSHIFRGAKRVVLGTFHRLRECE